MKGKTVHHAKSFTAHWTPELIMGTVEEFEGSPKVVSEQQFGIHAQVRGSPCNVTYQSMQVFESRLERHEGETDYHAKSCTTHWTPDFIMGTVEEFEGSHKVVSEQSVYACL